MDAILIRGGSAGAIALYMQLGFEPLVAEDWAGVRPCQASHVVPREVWARVMGLCARRRLMGRVGHEAATCADSARQNH